MFSGSPGERPRDIQTRLAQPAFLESYMLIKLRSKRPILENLRLYKHSYVVNTVEHPVSDYPKSEELVVAYGGRRGVVVHDNSLA